MCFVSRKPAVVDSTLLSLLGGGFREMFDPTAVNHASTPCLFVPV
jgi:hypothetical protein